MARGLRNGTARRGGACRAFGFIEFFLGLLAALGTAGASGAQGLFLDLTTPEVADVERAQTSGCGGGMLTGGSDGSIYVPPRPALRLEITHLNADTFSIGDEIVCELRITNTGGGPILIPWSVDRSIVWGPNCSWLVTTKGTVGVTLMLRLDLVDPQGYSQATVAHQLFGISSDHATVRTLGPHQSLRVKMADKTDVSYIQQRRAAANLRLNLPQRFTLAGALEWNDSAVFGAYSAVRSDNSFQVTISKR